MFEPGRQTIDHQWSKLSCEHERPLGASTIYSAKNHARYRAVLCYFSHQIPKLVQYLHTPQLSIPHLSGAMKTILATLLFVHAFVKTLRHRSRSNKKQHAFVGVHAAF